MKPDGQMFVIEANPNPQLAQGEDFAESAQPRRRVVREADRAHHQPRAAVAAVANGLRNKE